MLPKGFSRSQFPEVPRSCQNALFWLSNPNPEVPDGRFACPPHGVTASAEASPTSVPATATEVSFFGRLSQYSILMGSFIACLPIERRHARQWVAEEPSSQVPRLELGSAITIRQRQWKSRTLGERIK